MKNPKLERQILELVATDRIYIPTSSLYSKLGRMKSEIANSIELTESGYEGDRVYARTETDSKMKSRGTKEGIAEFTKQYPRYGKILAGMIAEKRAENEANLFFGTNPGCRLTADDYMDIMSNLGFTEARARALYGTLIDVSRDLSRKRQEERSILVKNSG